MHTRFFARVTVTGLLLNAAVSVAPAGAQQQVVPVTDSSFIQTAGSAALLQTKLANLAERKASSASVKEFGQQMAADYSKANQQLATAAKQAAYPAPVLLRQHQQVIDRFLGMNRSDFDKAYMAEAVKQHNEQVQLFEAESARGKVLSLKQLATGMLPQLRQRLSLATQTAGSVGADLTASSTAERGTNRN